MPTLATCSLVGHAYGPATPVGSGERAGASVKFYTVDRVKNANGEWEKEFTSHSAVCWGKEAEWLIRDCKKGSMVAVSGTFRIRKWEKEGKAGAGTEIQAQSAKVLDGEREGSATQSDATAPRRPVANKHDESSEVPF